MTVENPNTDPVAEKDAPKGTETAPEAKEAPEQADPVEVEARAGGWLPKEEFYAIPENAGKKWRSAELFVELTPMFEKIDALHKQNKTLNQGLKAFAEHNKKIEQAAYQRAVRDLKAQREAALEESDFVKAEKIRDQIDAMEPPTAVTIPDVPPEPPAAFQTWKASNRWYDTNEDARLFADTYGVKLANSGVHPDEVLKQVSAKVRTTFPHLFVNPKRENAPNVEGGSGKGKGGSGFQLTPEENAIMQKMIAAGAPITRDEYIAQVKASRGA